MVASELRCGNLIYAIVRPYEESKEIIKVEPTILMLLSGEIKKDNIKFEPIPITEEILLKCGAKKGGTTFWLSEDCVICTDFKFVAIYIDRLEDDIELDCPIYLHQLQNLYFALTGEELNVKL